MAWANTPENGVGGVATPFLASGTACPIPAIAGLKFWFAADAFVGATEGQTLTTLSDLSGNGNDAVLPFGQSGAKWTASGIDNHPGILFNGADSGPYATGTSFFSAAWNSNLSVFVVCRSTGNYPPYGTGPSLVNNPINGGDTSFDFYDFTRNNDGGECCGYRDIYYGVHGSIQTIALPVADYYEPIVMGFSNLTCYMDGFKAVDLSIGNIYTDIPAIPLQGALNIGALTFGSGYAEQYQGVICEIAVWNKALTETEAGQVQGYLMQKYMHKRRMVVLDGDSLTVGTCGTPGHSFAEQLGADLRDQWAVRNLALAGMRSDERLLNLPSILAGVDPASYPTLYTIMIGANDLQIPPGETNSMLLPYQTFANIAQILSRCNAAGIKVGICTVPALVTGSDSIYGGNPTISPNALELQDGPTVEANRQTLNSLIRSGTGFTLIDLASDPIMGSHQVGTDMNHGYFYDDDLHWRGAGYDELYPIYQDGIARMMSSFAFRTDAFGLDANGPVFTVVTDGTGGCLIGGDFTSAAGTPVNSIARFASYGLLDASFNPGANGAVRQILVQPNGKILVAGNFTVLAGQARSYLGRLNTDGSPDMSFNPGADSEVLAVALQPDGKIVVGGYFGNLGGHPCAMIGRLNPNGTLDPTFNVAANDAVTALAIQPDQKILAGGWFSWLGGQARNFIGRLNANGTLDTSFNPGADDGVNALAIQPDDGGILVGGWFTELAGSPCNWLGRLLTNGTADPTFSPNVNGTVQCLALQADGKILLGGSFTSVGGQVHGRIARVNADGSVDSGFDARADGPVNCLAIQSAHQIAVGGSFETLAGITRNNAGRVSDAPPASDADLTQLNLDAATLSPAFTAANYAYSAITTGSVVTVTAIPSDCNATCAISVNSERTNPGDPLALLEGRNTVQVQVLAEDGSTSQTYTVALVRQTAPETGSITFLSGSAIVLNATVDGNASRAFFQYGTTPDFGSTAVPDFASGAGTVSVSATLASPQTASLFYYRVGQTVAGMTTYGPTAQFATPVAPNTGAVTYLSASMVVLNATVDGNASQAFFQYGTSPDFGSTAAPDFAGGTGTVSISATLASIQAAAHYYYRVGQTLAGVTTFGATTQFVTQRRGIALVANRDEAAWAIPGAVFQGFGSPALSDSGRVAFRSTVSGPNIANYNNSGIWVGTGTSLIPIARTGDRAPGVSGGVFSTLGDPVIANNDTVAFIGTLKIGAGHVHTSNSSGVWMSGPTGPRLAARQGSPAPGCPPGTTFAAFSKVAIPDRTGPLFAASARIPATPGVPAHSINGTWIVDSRGKLRLLVRDGMAVNINGATLPVTSFSTMDGPNQTRSFNAAGDLLLKVASSQALGLVEFFPASGAFRQLASRGQLAADFAKTDDRYFSFGAPAIDNAGHCAFFATTATGAHPSRADRWGIWADTARGARRLIASGRLPMQAHSPTLPSLPLGLRIAEVKDPLYNNRNQVAFLANLTKESTPAARLDGGSAIWANTTGSLQPVAITNTQAPDCANGELFKQLGSFGLTDRGGVVLQAFLTSGNQGVWATDTTGRLSLLARTGDWVMIGSEAQCIVGLSIFDAGRPTNSQTRSFNGNGEVVFTATLSADPSQGRSAPLSTAIFKSL